MFAAGLLEPHGPSIWADRQLFAALSTSRADTKQTEKGTSRELMHGTQQIRSKPTPNSSAAALCALLAGPSDRRLAGGCCTERIHRLHQAYQQPHWTAFDSSSMMGSISSKASLTSSAAAATCFPSSINAEVASVTSSKTAAASLISVATSFVSEASSTRIVGCVTGCVTLGALLPLHPPC